jgi:exoribonuclease-2
VLRESGFEPSFGADVEHQVASLGSANPAGPALSTGAADLRALHWSSIDNTESRDLDQVEVAESLAGGDIRVRVGIADVDVLVPRGSPMDVHAQANATSVYTGVEVFPMLPERLSTDLTSLAEGQERLAIIVDFVIASDGTEKSHDVYRAVVQNHAKLAYDDVGAWLDGGQAPAKVQHSSVLLDQLHLQHEASDRLEAMRDRAGALELDTIEATPVARNGHIVDLAVVRKNRARELIENFMISANVAIAVFLEEHGASGIRRVVRAPERWSRIVELAAKTGDVLPTEPDSPSLARFLAKRRAADPDRFPDLSLAIVKLLGPGEYALDRPGKDPGGHFGLAAHDYSHATAPNRRYADLVTQRLVKAVLARESAPYTDDDLTGIAKRCTEREDAARKVERTMRKVAAALLLSSRIGETFRGIVTGVNRNGTFVRLLAPPAEGRVVRHQEGMDVGEYVQVRLIGTDADKGWIDFEGVRRS